MFDAWTASPFPLFALFGSGHFVLLIRQKSGMAYSIGWLDRLHIRRALQSLPAGPLSRRREWIEILTRQERNLMFL